MMRSDDHICRKMKPFNSCEWAPDTVQCLLEHYGEKYTAGRGCLRNKDWEDLVKSVNSVCNAGQSRPKTLKQCKDKIDSLKKRYKMEKNRVIMMGMPISTWRFFDKLHKIVSSLPKSGPALPANQAKPVSDLRVGCSVGELEYNNLRNGKEEMAFSSCGGSSKNNAHRWNVRHDSFESEGMTSSELPSDGEERPMSNEKKKRPTEDGSCLKKLGKISEDLLDLLSKKRRQASSNPVQAMVDAIVGFSDMYARVELAKLEIYTSMQLEIAKLERKRK